MRVREDVGGWVGGWVGGVEDRAKAGPRPFNYGINLTYNLIP